MLNFKTSFLFELYFLTFSFFFIILINYNLSTKEDRRNMAAKKLRSIIYIVTIYLVIHLSSLFTCFTGHEFFRSFAAPL